MIKTTIYLCTMKDQKSDKTGSGQKESSGHGTEHLNTFLLIVL